jgi:cytoskeletal protein RodZ
MASSRRARRHRGRKQRTRSLLTVVAVLLGALLMYQLVFRSDGSNTATSPLPAASSSANDTTTTTVPQEPSLPNSSFEELSVRDPFQPVVTTDSGSTGTVETTTTTASTSSATISTTPTTSPTQNPAPAQEISLLDVYTVNGVTTARVRVGGSDYTVVAGQTFATDYKLVQFTDTKCADFVHGSYTFNLCAGEQSNK